MRKIFFLFSVFIFLQAFTARAEEAYHTGLYFDLGMGGSFYAGQNTIPYVILLNLGYDFNPNWSAQVEWTHLGSQDNASSVIQARFIPEVKLAAASHSLRPYALAGLGIESDTVTLNKTNANSTNFDYADLTVGGGIQVTVEEAINLFLEAKLNYLLTSGSEATFPLAAGIHFDF